MPRSSFWHLQTFLTCVPLTCVPLTYAYTFASSEPERLPPSLQLLPASCESFNTFTLNVTAVLASQADADAFFDKFGLNICFEILVQVRVRAYIPELVCYLRARTPPASKVVEASKRANACSYSAPMDELLYCDYACMMWMMYTFVQGPIHTIPLRHRADHRAFQCGIE